MVVFEGSNPVGFCFYLFYALEDAKICVSQHSRTLFFFLIAITTYPTRTQSVNLPRIEQRKRVYSLSDLEGRGRVVVVCLSIHRQTLCLQLLCSLFLNVLFFLSDGEPSLRERDIF